MTFGIIWGKNIQKDDTIYFIDGLPYTKTYLKRLIWHDEYLTGIIQKRKKENDGRPICLKDPSETIRSGVAYYNNDYVADLIKENERLKKEVEILMRGD